MNHFTGSCHCGRVRFDVVGWPTQGLRCNCSICRRKGSLLHFVPAADFTLQTPREALAEYRFGRARIGHQFCKTCGCAPFAETMGPGGRPTVAVNLRCADAVDLAVLEIVDFDGASLN